MTSSPIRPEGSEQPVPSSSREPLQQLGKDQSGRVVQTQTNNGWYHSIASYVNNTFSSVPNDVNNVIKGRASLRDKVAAYKPDVNGTDQGENLKQEVEALKAQCDKLQQFHLTDRQRTNLEESDTMLNGILQEVTRKAESLEGKFRDLLSYFSHVVLHQDFSTPKHNIDEFTHLKTKLESFKQNQNLSIPQRDEINRIDYEIQLRLQREHIKRFSEGTPSFKDNVRNIPLTIESLDKAIALLESQLNTYYPSDRERVNSQIKYIDGLEDALISSKEVLQGYSNYITTLDKETNELLKDPRKILGTHQEAISELRKEIDKLKEFQQKLLIETNKALLKIEDITEEANLKLAS